VDDERKTREHSSPGPGMLSTGSYLAPNCNMIWAVGQSEPGGPEKLLLQGLAMSCIGLINDLAALHFHLKMEEDSKLRRPRKCLRSMIALIRLLGEVIGHVDWLHSDWG
jgi:hypothetical protein